MVDDRELAERLPLAGIERVVVGTMSRMAKQPAVLTGLVRSGDDRRQVRVAQLESRDLPLAEGRLRLEHLEDRRPLRVHGVVVDDRMTVRTPCTRDLRIGQLLARHLAAIPRRSFRLDDHHAEEAVAQLAGIAEVDALAEEIVDPLLAGEEPVSEGIAGLDQARLGLVLSNPRTIVAQVSPRPPDPGRARWPPESSGTTDSRSPDCPSPADS